MFKKVKEDGDTILSAIDIPDTGCIVRVESIKNKKYTDMFVPGIETKVITEAKQTRREFVKIGFNTREFADGMAKDFQEILGGIMPSGSKDV